jgi:arylsulfatase A-like enzyme
VVDAFLGWLAGAPDHFFAWVHVYDPHASYEPPAGFSLGFPGRLYDGEIAYVDAQLGRLIEALGRRFDPAGTLIVVTLDHGESLGEHGEQGHSFSVYDATQRVPMIWNGSGFHGGRAVPDVVRLTDVAPTLLAMAGAKPLAETNGRDLCVVARGGESLQPAHSETLATHFDYGWSALFSIRTEQWRYIHAPQPELYDVHADPSELRNLVSEKPDVARELDAWIEARRTSARPLDARGGLSTDARACKYSAMSPEPPMRRTPISPVPIRRNAWRCCRRSSAPTPSARPGAGPKPKRCSRRSRRVARCSARFAAASR